MSGERGVAALVCIRASGNASDSITWWGTLMEAVEAEHEVARYGCGKGCDGSHSIIFRDRGGRLRSITPPVETNEDQPPT